MEVEVLFVVLQEVGDADRHHGIVQVKSNSEVVQLLELDAVALFHERLLPFMVNLLPLTFSK